MNPSIYDYQLPELEYGKELDLMFEIPFNTIRPLSINDNKLSLLVDLDTNNENEMIHLLRLRAYQDFNRYCRNSEEIAIFYKYLGCQNGVHYFFHTFKKPETIADIFI